MKKGFTLVELLAVIIVLSVISLITIAVIQNNIDVTRKSSFETSVKNVIDAAKEYVITNYEENDFPEGGIDITNGDLDLKNSEFISGLITKSNEAIQVVNLTNGKFCANGTKNSLEVVAGSCEAFDETKPNLSIKVLKTKIDSIIFLVKFQDAQSGIKELEYCVDSCDKKEVISFDGERTLVKKVIEIKNLKQDHKYDFNFKVRNNSGNEDIEEQSKTISASTLIVDEPKFKISSSAYTSSKIVKILYPNIEGYKFSYELAGQEVFAEKNEVELEISENTKVIARIYKDSDLIIESKLNVSGIDVEPPLTMMTIPDIDIWTSYKTITLTSIDQPKETGVGLALRAYSFDKGITWEKSNQKKYSAATKVTASTRDKIGNISNRFTVNCNPLEETCEWYTEYPPGGTEDVLKIDSVAPVIYIEVTKGDKTSPTNEWYISDYVEVTATIKDRASKIINGEEKILEDYGIGVDISTLKIVNNNEYKETKNQIDLTNNVSCTGNATGTTYVCKFIVDKNGINNLNIEVSDKKIAADDGNGYKKEPYIVKETFKVKKDNELPTLSPNGTTLYNTKLDQSGIFNNHFNKYVGASGIASYSCNPTSLYLQNSNVSCEFTNGAGRNVSAATTSPLKYYYAATAYTATCSSTSCSWEGSCDGHYTHTYSSNDHSWGGGMDTVTYYNDCHRCMDYVCHTSYFSCIKYSCPHGGSLSGTTCYG